MKKRFLALLLALVMVVALLPTIALAADETPAEPVITVTGQDILTGVSGMKDAPFLIACKDTNAMTAALTQDGKTIESGVTWSFGTNQLGATIDPSSGAMTAPKWTNAANKGYLEIKATYNGKAYTLWLYAISTDMAVQFTNGYTLADDGYYTYTLDETGKPIPENNTPYFGFGPLGEAKLLDFSSSEPDFVTVSYSNGSAVYVVPQQPGTTVLTASIKGHPEYKLNVNLRVKGVKVADANGVGGVHSVFKGEKLALTAFDGNEDSTYTWTTTNKTVATVKNGVVTARKEGVAYIYATSSSGVKGGMQIYVYENSKKPYLDDLSFSGGDVRLKDENGGWLNEKDPNGGRVSEQFSRTRWDYGVYLSFSSGVVSTYRVTPSYDNEKYTLAYYVNGEKQDEIASGAETTLELYCGETDAAFRLQDKQDENCFTEYHIHFWRDYSTNGKFSKLVASPVGRMRDASMTFTMENALNASYYFQEGLGYSVRANGKIASESVSGTYTPWFSPSGVLNSYLFSDMEAFQLEAAGMDNSVIAWSQGVPWQTPASDDALPEGWQAYDASNIPTITWKADEGQDYMTIYLRSISKANFLEYGYLADPSTTMKTATNVSDRELHVYKLPFQPNDVTFTDLRLSEGSFMTPAFTAGSTKTSAVVPADCKEVTVKLKANEGVQIYRTVNIKPENLMEIDEDGYSITKGNLSGASATVGCSGVLTVPKNDSFSYSVCKSIQISLSKTGDMKGLPDAVVDYVAPGSQYTNGRQTAFTGGRMYALYPERTLLGNTEWTNVTSLGAYGGYITWYFKDAIQDDPNHIYGVDFQVFGNSYANGNGGFGAGEAGQVWVSEDGKQWYALAGSEHFEDDVNWNYQFTYKNTNSNYGYDWTDNLGNSGTYHNEGVGAEYPSPSMYPLHDFGKNSDELTVGGVLLPWRVHWDMFGYVDSLASSPSYGSGGAGAGDDITGTLENPYARTGYASAFDLAWAVDAEGNPVTFKNGIHYVKVQTAVYQAETGIMGELSTEVCTALRASEQEKAVGRTAGAQSIVISDGDQSVTLSGTDFKKTSDTVYEANVDAGQMRNLSFTVNAADDDYIIVNNRSTKNGVAAPNTYSISASKSRTVRVIVQSGKQEPISYFLHITGSAVVSEKVLAVENAIRAIGSVGQGSGEAIRSARAMYDALSEAEQASVSNYAVLVAAEKEYEDIINASIGKSDEMITVSMAIEKTTLGQDYILEPTLVTIPKDTTAAQLLVALLGNDKVQYKGTPTASFYLSYLADAAEEVNIPEKILERAGKDLTNTRESNEWLGEFDYASTSGWMYSVNGSFPSVYASEKTMQDGDVIRWQFTVAGIGADVGDANSENPMQLANKEALTKLVSQVNALDDSDGFVKANADAYRAAVAALIDWSADQETVDAAYAALQAALDKALQDNTYGKISAVNIAADRAIAKVIALIDAIPADVTLDAKDAVTAARAAYDKLPTELQQYVTNLEKLTAAEAKIAELEKPEKPTDLPFTDLTQDWYMDSIRYVYEHELMYGTTDTTFAPDDALTRGMFVTMLYRMEGKPEATGNTSFTDVPAGAYYADAVAWASANGVVYGTSETAFSPEGKITREQMAAMMRRYASFKKLDTSAKADITTFVDASAVSAWASDDMKWAVASELLYGNNHNELQPTANATRAQAAAILQRFATKIVK